jgi:hypothetical protein
MADAPQSDDADVQLVCTDLMFTSKVTGVGREFGRKVRVFPSIERAVAAVGPNVRLALLDLAHPPRFAPDDVRQWKAALPAGATLAAYGSHVEVDSLRAAKAAGCDEVFVRSEFVRLLPSLMTGEADGS